MENDAEIHIKDTRGWVRQLAVMMGFVTGLFAPLAIHAAAIRDWSEAAGGVGFLAFFGLIWWLACRATPEDVAILSRDHVVLPGNRLVPKFQWSDVEKIRWPKGRNQDGCACVRISLAHTSRMSSAQIPLGAASVSSEDRLILIRYLRLVGTHIPQENWPTFCQWCAVPTVIECEGKDTSGGPEEKASEAPTCWASALLRAFFRIGERSPFLLGLATLFALPLLCPLVLAILMSRKAWWLFSILLGISAAINLPLVVGWNAWVATWLIVIPLVPLILSIFAPSEAQTSKAPADCVPGGIVWLVVTVLGIPFLLAASVNGWVPAALAKYVLLGYVCGFPFLLLLAVHRQKRLQDVDRNQRESEALQRWAAYENSERLPDLLAPQEGCGQ